MKKILLMAFGILLLTGCSSDKKLEIKLDGNPTTGYEWTCEIEDDKIIKEISSDYESGNDNVEGASGTYTFVYEGIKEGTTTLTCNYARSFEENSTEDSKEYKITVDKDLYITYKEINND